MPNTYFSFKQFTIYQDRCAMKVTTDGCLFGSWCANEIYKLIHSQVYLLDIGAGTGLLSLMIAQKNKCVIDAIEIDKEAAMQAIENISASPWNKKIYVVNE
ncbi:MAG: 50S ribosomal protein L11 methyltransferase, partial [Bacteroidota bacterium]|nr:50S ribosomal protein L11 methyltransferase [Bacteroidota bacterium]